MMRIQTIKTILEHYDINNEGLEMVLLRYFERASGFQPAIAYLDGVEYAERWKANNSGDAGEGFRQRAKLVRELKEGMQSVIDGKHAGE